MVASIPIGYSTVANTLYPEDFGSIQAAINAATSGFTVLLRSQSYTEAVVSCKSGVNLVAAYEAIFNGRIIANGVNNVSISGIRVQGQGIWSAVPTVNNTVGFTNSLIGISVIGSTNVSVLDCGFSGYNRGINVTGSTNVTVKGNTVSNCGQAGIACWNSKTLNIEGNTISGIYGNITNPGDTDIAHSYFADGIYLYCVNGCTVVNNPLIEDIVRIGVTLESDLVTLNVGVTVRNNYIRNLHSSRAGQTNCAVWCEPYNSIDVVIDGNTFDNTGVGPNDPLYPNATAHGINAYDCIVTNNVITGFKYGAGIFGANFDAKNNRCSGNGYGIVLNDALRRSKCVISGNTLTNNYFSGLCFTFTHGSVDAFLNQLQDNGQRVLPGQLHIFLSGIAINGCYSDQSIKIHDNTFVSSANEGNANGQLYAISNMRDPSGDVAYDKANVTNCTFKFTGTFTDGYPAKMSVAPASFARISSDDLTVAIDEILNVGGNVNSKIP